MDYFSVDPWTSGLDLGSELGIQIPRYGTDYSQIAFGTEPTTMSPDAPSGPKSIADYIGYGARLAEAVRDAYAAYKGFGTPYSSNRAAGQRLGDFLKEQVMKERAGASPSKAATKISQGLSSIFDDPAVLVDIFNSPQITGFSIDPARLKEALPYTTDINRRNPFEGVPSK